MVNDNERQRWNPQLAKLMVDDIRIANRVRGDSWAVYPVNDEPVLGIFMYTVLSIADEGNFTFAVDPDELPQSVLDELEPRSQKRDLHMSGVSHYDLDIETFNRLSNSLLPAHQAVVRNQAIYKSRRWPWHRGDFIEELTAITGEEVPEPTYLEALEQRNAAQSTGQADSRGYNARTADVSGFWLKGVADEEFETSIDNRRIIEDSWTVVPDLRSLPEEREEFVRQIKREHNVAGRSASRAWFFAYGMEPGDWIFLHTPRRPYRVAVGRVAGDYMFEGDQHRRPVEWLDSFPIELGGKSLEDTVGRTTPNWLTPLPGNAFRRLIDRLPSELASHILEIVGDSPEAMTMDEDDTEINMTDIPLRISSHFASHGLTYTDTQIAEFYTALQTKGFVVLSGISGTGKSKIAQHFTEMLPDAVVQEVVGPDPVSTDEGLTFRISKSENWSAVGAEQSGSFPRVPTNTKFDVRFVFEGGAYSGSYKLRILAGGRPTLYFSLGHTLTQKLRTSSGETGTVYAQFMPAANDTSLPEVRLSTSRPDRVEGQVYEDIDISTTLFLSVRPDWRDSTSLLGYYNPLTQTYEWTDFLRFVINAVDNMNSGNPVAWFVILDEMNLAHVEYYFADLLSVLESGRDSRGFTTEPIRLTYPDTVINDTPPTEIFLPPNLYIIGTVNMDETTHAFSPKVLDRAFTMELSDVDFLGYQPGNMVDLTQSPAIDKSAMLSAFTMNGWPGLAKSRISQYVDHHPEIREALHDLNTQLARNRFHFGYRVFDEIVQFLANAEANTMFSSMEDAFDSAVFMKILPKFSGSEGRVGAPLQSLHTWAEAPFGDGSPPLARTLKRVTFMRKRLEEDGFVTAF